MIKHLVQTPEAFAVSIERKHGADARLHPVNRMTRCGKRSADLRTSTVPADVNCASCRRSIRAFESSDSASLWPTELAEGATR